MWRPGYVAAPAAAVGCSRLLNGGFYDLRNLLRVMVCRVHQLLSGGGGSERNLMATAWGKYAGCSLLRPSYYRQN